jgi:hypothetical protein
MKMFLHGLRVNPIYLQDKKIQNLRTQSIQGRDKFSLFRHLSDYFIKKKQDSNPFLNNSFVVFAPEK